MSIRDTDILWPAVAMASLTFVVWCRLYVVRLGEMRQKRIHPQAVATPAKMAELLSDSRASDNFRNLFELPTLFYVALLLAFVLGPVTGSMLFLAWSFVLLRVLHSLIQCTLNRVMWRFTSYMLSSLALWLLWACLAWQFWPS